MAKSTPYLNGHADLSERFRTLGSKGAEAQEALRAAQVRYDASIADEKRAEREELLGLADRRSAARDAVIAATDDLRDATRRAEEVPGAQREIREQKNTLVAANIGEAFGYAQEAQARIEEAVRTAIDALDELDAIAERELPAIDQLRPTALDGIVVGHGAMLLGDRQGARVALAGLQVRWPPDVDPKSGAARNAAGERQESFARQQAERDAVFAAWNSGRS